MAAVNSDTPQRSAAQNADQNKENTTTTASTPQNAGSCAKKRRIRFSNAWDILLLKAVTAIDAHLAPHGEAESRFEEALNIFKGAVPAGCFETVAAPTWKNLNDRFKKILSDHREASKTNAAASGIIEVRGERETLLDDVMLEVDEFEEAKRAERDKKTELDKRLLQAGEEIRARANSRSRCGAEDGDENGEGTAPNQESKKRPLSSDSDEEDRALMSEHIKSRRHFEQKRLEIEQKWLEFEMKRDEREASRLQKAQQIDMRRVAVDEKRMELEANRFVLESEERKGAIAERKEVSSVLGEP